MKMFWKLTLVCVVTLLSRGCDGQPPPPFVCGRAPLNTRIVGGTNASAGAWPWQVSLHESGSHFCGGSLINNQWILTAAHCFYGSANASAYTVYLGRQSQELPNPNEVSRSVSQVITHPSYNPSTNDNDMCLLHLSSPVNYTNYIQPVCLAAEDSTFNSDTMWVTGWGTIGSGVSLPSPQILQEVDVPMVGNSKCNCAYSGSITDNMMCAGTPQGGKDSCQGDSGGPMVIKQGSSWIQAGVVSFGQGCAEPDYPGVYARVSQYQQWITQNVGMAGFFLYSSTTPAQDGNVTCPTPPILCGGTASSYPWMATLSYNGIKVCVGTLVSDQFILTSASCFNRFTGVSGWTVSLNVASLWDCSSFSTVSSDVANIIFDNDLSNGIALVQLSNPMYSIANLPVEMYYQSFGPGAECVVIGQNSWYPSPEPSFQEFQTTIVNCDFSDFSHSHICTEPVNVQQDDQGSPLLCRNSYMWIQVGILSSPNGGGMNPQNSNSTVFTSIATFTNFFTNNLYNIPVIFGGAESFSPLSLTCTLLLSLPAVLQAFY